MLLFSPLFQGTKYMSLHAEWVSACRLPACLPPHQPAHLRRPLTASCLVVNCPPWEFLHKTLPEEFFHKTLPEESSIRLLCKNGNSSRGIYSYERLLPKNGDSSRGIYSYIRLLRKTTVDVLPKTQAPSHSSSVYVLVQMIQIWGEINYCMSWSRLNCCANILVIQCVMCYMGLVTCYVKALLSMGKQGTKSFARDFLIFPQE